MSHNFSYAFTQLFTTQQTNCFQSIVSSNLDGSLVKTVISDDIKKPEDVAIDYIGRNIYFTDPVNVSIGVCTIGGLFCQGIITTGLKKPRGIAVYPTKGLLVYTDWGNPHIALSGMDGQDLQILVNTSITWPNGVTFDMPSERIFWGEAYNGLLESIRLDGSGRHAVKPANNLMTLHPFFVAVFEDTIFWSDWGMNEIQSCHKFTGLNHMTLIKEPRLHLEVNATLWHNFLNVA
jgi:hypothetical protein